MTEGQVTAVRVRNEEGDLIHVELDPYWTEEESPDVLTVHVRRYGGDGQTPLGRIDRRERVYHVRHHELADFVRWSDRTVTLSVEELILASKNEVREVQYLDERNGARYSIPMEMVRSEGYIVRREKIGWRWATPLMMWTKRRVA
jgi:hypothetical protein